jgi:hypothetical protein
MMNKILFDMDIKEYHKNPALGSTDLKALSKSSAHYKALRSGEFKQTAAMLTGSVLHTAVLEPDKLNQYAFHPEYGKSKANIEKFENFKKTYEGKILVPEKLVKDNLIQNVQNAVNTNESAKLLLYNSKIEHSIFWTDNDINFKCRPDAYKVVDGICFCVDLKTTADASPDKFEYSIREYGYHIQAAHYLNGLKAAVKADSYQFYFIAVEKDAPYNCAVYSLHPQYIEIGNIQIAKAIENYKTGKKNNFKTGYSDGITELEPPKWFTYKYV